LMESVAEIFKKFGWGIMTNHQQTKYPDWNHNEESLS
jgi:hypothetical protein